MIVFDLRCANEHVFEARFADSEAFENSEMVGKSIAQFVVTEK